MAPTRLPPEVITASRVWLASAALAAVLVLRPSLFDARPNPAGNGSARRTTWLAVGAGGLLAAHWTLQFAAYERAPAPTVSFVIFLAPIGVAALAPWALSEPTPLRTVGALAVALIGAALVTGPPSRGASFLGLVFAAGSAVGLIGLTLLAKPLAQALGGARAALAQFAVASVVLSPVVIGLISGRQGRPSVSWLWLTVLGFVHTALFVSAYLWALARLPVATVGVIGQLEPVGVTIVAALQGNLPPATTLFGGALILAAGALVATKLPPRPAAAPSPMEAPNALG